ncbi:MAG: hypothetical protein U0T56_01925 [Ferruginibacter sp.]
MQRPGKIAIPLFILYFLISALTYVFWKQMDRNHIDVAVVRLANTILLLISLGSLFLQMKAMKNPNPHAFVRGVMTSLILKMLVCVAAVFIYHATSGDAFNKRAVFISLFLYLAYLAVEGSVLTKLNRNKDA